MQTATATTKTTDAVKDAPRLSYAQVAELLRTVPPENLTPLQRHEVAARLNESPAIHVLAGGEAFCRQYLEKLQALEHGKAGTPQPGDSFSSAPQPQQESGAPRRFPWWKALAGLALLGAAAFFALRSLSDSGDSSEQSAKRPATSSAAAANAGATAEPNASGTPPRISQLPAAAPAATPPANPESAPVSEAMPPAAEVPKPSAPLAMQNLPAEPDIPLPLPGDLDGKRRPGREQNEEIRLDNPEGEYSLDALNGRKKVQLSGRIKRLIVGPVNGQAVLDASALTAREVIFSESINGSSTVSVHCPKGRVELVKSLNGNCQVEINAPNGEIVLGEGEKNVLGGSCRLKLRAATVDVKARLGGGCTVDATLDEGGRLRFASVSEGAALRYRKADPSHPDVTLEQGRVTGGGKVSVAQ